MTSKERFIAALKRQPITGHVPHFELVFYLTMEAFGKVHPSHRHYGQWDQMSANERRLQINDMADCYVLTAKRYHHDAIFVHPNPGDLDSVVRLLERIRELSGDEYYIMMHGDVTHSIPNGDRMLEFTAQLYEEPEKLHAGSRKRIERQTILAEELSKRAGLLDGFALCSDYCFNVNPFFTPSMFGEFITPFLDEVIRVYHQLGFFAIKHTDGNIMPILDQMVACGPDALHSLDPQGGVDLKEVKRLVGEKVCLIGNVNCGLLQTGSEEAVAADVRRALRDGMPGYGYIFSTSNCAYTGLALDRYEMMHDIWRAEGVYR